MRYSISMATTTSPAPFVVHAQGGDCWPWPHARVNTREEAYGLAHEFLAAGHPQVEIDEYRASRRRYRTIDQLRTR